MHQTEGIELSTWTIRSGRGPTLHLQVQVQPAREMPQQEVLGLQERITGRLQRPVTLTHSAIPVTHYEPLSTPVLAGPTPSRILDQE